MSLEPMTRDESSLTDVRAQGLRPRRGAIFTAASQLRSTTEWS